jgi:DNA-binding MarR family transcriptional regulator
MAREPAQNQLQQSPMHLLHRAGQLADSLFMLGDSKITPRQLAILIAVAEDEGTNQAGLVARTGIDRSTMTDLVQRMQRKGLIQRQRTADDARADDIKLTEQGRRALRTVKPLAQKVDQQLLTALTGKQREQLLDALKSIVAAMPQRSVKAS